MSKTALLFPGQASQYVGMGKEIYDSSSDVRALYDLASNEIGQDIAKLSFEGPAETLKQTRFTQPAILLHTLAVLEVLGDKCPSFDYACGHSLGEYAALVATQALTKKNAVRAVVKRAALMEEACQNNPGTMAAILGLNEEQVNEVCKQASASGIVIPANFNSKVQIAVSGTLSAVQAAVIHAKEAGAKRAMILEVGGAFHSPLMESAKVGLEQFLSQLDIRPARVPVVANVIASPVTGADEIRSLLVRQVTSPVKWAHTMKFLVDNGVTQIIEIGPGKVLTGLAKRDMRPEKSVNLDTLNDIEQFAAMAV